MYQSLIIPNIVMGSAIDWSKDANFQIKKEESGDKKYGKYIFKNTNHDPDYTGKKIYHRDSCHKYLREEYLRQNTGCEDYHTVFSFKENSYNSSFDPRDPFKGKAVEGEVEDIGSKKIVLFNGPIGSEGSEDVLGHEILHNMGVYHTYQDEEIIKTPNVLVTFPKKATNNFMAFAEIH